MIILTNAILDDHDVYTILCIQLLRIRRLFRRNQSESHQSISDFQSYALGNQKAELPHPFKLNILVGNIGKKTNGILIT